MQRRCVGASGIKYEIELSMKIRIYSRIEIVNVGCSFIVRNVERPYLRCPQESEERVGEAPMREIRTLGLGHAVPERLQDPMRDQRPNDPATTAHPYTTGPLSTTAYSCPTR